MTTLQLDANGLQTQTQEEIVDDLGERLQATFGANLKIDVASIMGQIIHVVAELRSLDQQTLLDAYASFDPNGARGAALDARMTLTGSTRLGATASFVDGILTFSGAGTMNNGDLVRNDDNDTLWKLTDGPHTSMVGPWPEVIAAQMTAVEKGPTLANAGTTWSAVTSVPNLTGFTNPSDDAEVGRLLELDAAARQRRLLELYSQGQGPLATIQGAVSKISGIDSVRVYHNPATFPVDGNSIPFKAFNVVAETTPTIPTAALQQLIHSAIWSAMGAGGEAYGTSYTGTVTDSEGVAQPTAFDTVTVVDVELEVDLVTSTSEDAITPNIVAVVKAQILAVAQADYEVVGRDVRALDFKGIVQAMLAAGTISGVDDVVVRIGDLGLHDIALVAKYAIGLREKADFDSANVTVAQT